MAKSGAVVLAVVVAAGLAVGGVALDNARRNSGSSEQRSPVALSTTKVEQRDLVTYTDTTATLGFTTSVTVSSPVAGTITSIVGSGEKVDAGTVIATIDGAPVVAMLGDIPGYRQLSSSSAEGADVRQLETNLVLLGFDPDGEITIDESFDAATKAAVNRWEASLGLVGDGTVPQSQVVFIPGTLLVDTISADIGGAAQAGSSLFVARQTERKFPIITAGDGIVVDKQAAPGTAVTTGTVLFWKGYTPVVAIEGDAAALPALTRDLFAGVADGADVRLLETMLAAGGFDPNGAMPIDDRFDDATATAVSNWYGSFGLVVAAADIVVPAGSLVVVPAGLSVGAAVVADGTTIVRDQVVQSLTSAARAVNTTAPIGDATFAMGAPIEVLFPDGTTQTGAVVAVGNVATNTSNVPGATPSVPITIHVDNIPASVDGFVQIPVTLRAVAEAAPDALVVPVSALVTLAEGGYAIEVVTGTDANGANTTALEGVTPGLFSDGFVAITGDQVKVGQVVVVPS